MQPIISCIMATKNRSRFVRQSIKYFLRQTYENKELIVIEDGDEHCGGFVGSYSNVQYIRLENGITLGEKLNIGIERAKGRLIQKWDDDDYYGPGFLRLNIGSWLAGVSDNVVVCHDCFPVFLAKSRRLKQTEAGWCAGGTFCFHKDLWQKIPFRSVGAACDWLFLEDHSPTRCKIIGSESYILIRHTENTWNSMGSEKVDDYMDRLPDYSRRLEEVIGKEDSSFYFELSNQLGSMIE